MQRVASPIGILVDVEPHERDQLVGRGRGVRERSVVRRAERRVPVGLVEAEDERAGDPVRALDLEQLVAVADHPVDVLAEMDVRVEERRPLRKLVARQPRVLLAAGRSRARWRPRAECMDAQAAERTRSTNAGSGTDPAHA